MFPLEGGGGSRRGFYLIGLLIVLAIIAILTYKQISPEEKAGEVKQANLYIDRSRVATCNANRTVVVNTIAMWQINHMGEKPTMEKLQQGTSAVPRCPEGGEYIISDDGRRVYCTIHDPPPEEPEAAAPAGQFPLP